MSKRRIRLPGQPRSTKVYTPKPKPVYRDYEAKYPELRNLTDLTPIYRVSVSFEERRQMKGELKVWVKLEFRYLNMPGVFLFRGLPWRIENMQEVFMDNTPLSYFSDAVPDELTVEKCLEVTASFYASCITKLNFVIAE